MSHEITRDFGLRLPDFEKLEGKLKLSLYDKNGKLKDQRVLPYPNTITTNGDMITADAMSDRGETLPSHMAVGTTSGGKSTASNALEAEVGRVALDSTTQGGGADDNDVIWVATFGAAVGTGVLLECGLFNGTPAGDMYAYQEFAAISKGAGDSLVVTWTCTYGAS